MNGNAPKETIPAAPKTFIRGVTYTVAGTVTGILSRLTVCGYGDGPVTLVEVIPECWSGVVDTRQ